MILTRFPLRQSYKIYKDEYIKKLEKKIGKGVTMELEEFSNKEIHVIVFQGEYTVAFFCMEAMPGCNAIIIFNNVMTLPRFQNKGVGTLLHEMRLDIARASNYPIAMCTVNNDNDVQKKILFSHQWECISVENKLNHHTILVCVKEL